MTHDLAARLTSCLADIQLLSEARQDVLAEYHPRAQTYDPQRRMQGPPNEGPLPIRLDQQGHPQGQRHDGDWRQAMRLLVSALQDAKDADAVRGLLPLIRPLVEHPDVDSDRDNLSRLSMAHDVTHRAADALHCEGLSGEDYTLLLGWCEDVSEVVMALPKYLRGADQQQQLCVGREVSTGGRPAVPEMCPDRRVATEGSRCSACKRYTSRTRASLEPVRSETA